MGVKLGSDAWLKPDHKKTDKKIWKKLAEMLPKILQNSGYAV